MAVGVSLSLAFILNINRVASSLTVKRMLLACYISAIINWVTDIKELSFIMTNH